MAEVWETGGLPIITTPDYNVSFQTPFVRPDSLLFARGTVKVLLSRNINIYLIILAQFSLNFPRSRSMESVTHRCSPVSSKPRKCNVTVDTCFRVHFTDAPGALMHRIYRWMIHARSLFLTDARSFYLSEPPFDPAESIRIACIVTDTSYAW